MNTVLLFEYFDILTTAPEGITRLRDLILQLAMQGELGTQDENDEPASILLEKITNSITNRSDTKRNNYSQENNTIVYKIPNNWVWTKLGAICYQITDGTHITPKYVDNGVPFLSVKDISSGFIDFSDVRYISETEHKELVKRCCPEYGDILLTKVGTTGIAKEIDTTIQFSIFVSLALLKFPKDLIIPRFLELMINSPFIKQQSKMGTQGVGNKNLVLKTIKNFDIALPPIEEQKRIIAKVDRIMALCDELDVRQKQERMSCLNLGIASIIGLLDTENDEEFEQRWSLICRTFDILLDYSENVALLRGTILQLAVFGKLGTQDAMDEPASMIMERIKKEKNRLENDNISKQEKSIEKINTDEVSFTIPKSWVLTRLGEIAQYNSEIKVPSKEVSDDAWILDLEDIEKDTSRILHKIQYKDRKSLSTKSRFKKGDVLYGKLRPYLNKVVIADEDGYCTTEIVPIRPYANIDPKYLMYTLKTPYFLAYVNSKTYGIKMPRLGTADALNAIIPLPPLNEQQRIIAKVDTLMALCDKLEERLNNRDEAKGKYATTIVKQLLMV